MKFHCGPTIAERIDAIGDRETKRREQWHPFFALLPRRIGQDCYWLQFIRRKGRRYEGYSADLWFYEYRAPLLEGIDEVSP